MKILTVLTGGTISCSKSDGVLSPDSGNGKYLLDAAARAGVRAEFVTTQPYLVLSENLGAEHLKALRACILSRLGEGFDGIIVTHGTDTLPTTAAYLDYVLGAAGLPIALVSANYPLRDPRSNGLANFSAAVALIRAGERGVFVAYQNTGEPFATIHRGRDVLPHMPLEDSVFSLFRKPFGFVREGAFVRNPDYPQTACEDLSGCELSGSVMYLHPQVGATYPALPDGTKAVLFEGWHSGTLPTARPAFIAFCRQVRQKGVPLFLTGSQEGFAYESKQAFADLGIQVLPPMSPVAAYMKLWLMGRDER